MQLGRSVVEPKIDPKKLQEERKRPQEMMTNHFEAARGRRSEKKDNKYDKQKGKRAPESALKQFGRHLELPRSPQDHPKWPEEAVEGTQKEPRRFPKRSQKHRRIQNVVLTEFVKCPS